MNTRPIGIFDSGVGGLTVASAIKNLLPNENIIYFGDTGHNPYGDKSGDLIKYYSVKITDFLLAQNCKTIVIACNTASAQAYEEVLGHITRKSLEIPVINVIDPLVELISEKQTIKRIGVIGTKGTINSGTYQEKIASKIQGIEVVSLSTPILVPLIEEGFIYDDISNAVIRNYLSNKKLKNIDALVLGCTHYPIIKNQIRKYYDFNLSVLDSGQIVAYHLKKILSEHNLLNNEDKSRHIYYVSDYTNYFQKIAEMFFDEHIELTVCNLWKE